MYHHSENEEQRKIQVMDVVAVYMITIINLFNVKVKHFGNLRFNFCKVD